MRSFALLSLLLLVCAFPALAEPPATPARALLTLADTPASLRSQLLTYADSAVDAGDHVGAGEALSYAGTSFQREGRLDSAIVCHRRALELLGTRGAAAGPRGPAAAAPWRRGRRRGDRRLTDRAGERPSRPRRLPSSAGSRGRISSRGRPTPRRSSSPPSSANCSRTTSGASAWPAWRSR